MFPLLETLVAVYEVGQFTLAADELKVSQSTVSSRIAQLEQMVGAPLFRVVPEFLRTLVFARPRGDDQFADCTFSPSLDMSR